MPLGNREGGCGGREPGNLSSRSSVFVPVGRGACGDPHAATLWECCVASVATTTLPDVPRDRSRTVTLVLFAVLAAAIVASFLIGPAGISPGARFAGLFDGQGAAGVIAREIRLPRAALAIVVGAALGASGAALQGLFRNPLAEPGVTGVTSSAGLGAVLALYFGLAAESAALLPAFAIDGADGASVVAGAQSLRDDRDGALDAGIGAGSHRARPVVRRAPGPDRHRVAGQRRAWAGCADAGRGSGAEPGRERGVGARARGAGRGAGHRRSDGGGRRGEFCRTGGAACVAAVLRLSAIATGVAVGTGRRGAGDCVGRRDPHRGAGRAIAAGRADRHAGRAVLPLADPPSTEGNVITFDKVSAGYGAPS